MSKQDYGVGSFSNSSLMFDGSSFLNASSIAGVMTTSGYSAHLADGP
jgi:hypothetical protein